MADSLASAMDLRLSDGFDSDGIAAVALKVTFPRRMMAALSAASTWAAGERVAASAAAQSSSIRCPPLLPPSLPSPPPLPPPPLLPLRPPPTVASFAASVVFLSITPASSTHARSASALFQQHAGTRSDGCRAHSARVLRGHSWILVSSRGAYETTA